MADREPGQERHGWRLSPVGIEPILNILSALAHILNVVRAFGLTSRRHRRIRHKFWRLREATLRLNNCLDDLVLTIQRHLQYIDTEGSALPVTERRPTFSATILSLQEADNVRWIDLQDTLHELSKSIYELTTDIREAVNEVEDDWAAEVLGIELFAPVDELLVGFGSLTFGEFVAKLRSVLASLTQTMGVLLSPAAGE